MRRGALILVVFAGACAGATPAAATPAAPTIPAVPVNTRVPLPTATAASAGPAVTPVATPMPDHSMGDDMGDEGH